MNQTKLRLRLISLLMPVVAIIFLICALSAPNPGTAFYVGQFSIGAEVWRVCYAVYGIGMATLFLASFFVKDPQKSGKE